MSTLVTTEFVAQPGRGQTRRTSTPKIAVDTFQGVPERRLLGGGSRGGHRTLESIYDHIVRHGTLPAPELFGWLWIYPDCKTCRCSVNALGGKRNWRGGWLSLIPGVVLLALVIGACASASNRATTTSPSTVPDGAASPTNESSCGVGGNAAVQKLLMSRHIAVTTDGETLGIRTIGFQVCVAAQGDLMAKMFPSLQASAQSACQPWQTTNVRSVTTSSGVPVQGSTTSPLTTAIIPPTTNASTPPVSMPPTTGVYRHPNVGSVPPSTWVSQPPQVSTASTNEVESGIAQAILDDLIYRDAVAKGRR